MNSPIYPNAHPGHRSLRCSRNCILITEAQKVNILVDEHGIACLSDFGVSTVEYDCKTLNTITQISNFKSTLRWMAPEMHDPERFGLTSAKPSKEGDVYSYAMVMWEVFTKEVPFGHLREGAALFKIITGERPQRPDSHEVLPLGLSDGVWSIMETCWDADRFKRPAISEVILSLENEWGSTTNSSTTLSAVG